MKFKVGDRVKNFGAQNSRFYGLVGTVVGVDAFVRVYWGCNGLIGVHSPKFLYHELSYRNSGTDVVDKPAHYQFFPDLEAIEVIARSMTQEQFYGYCLGNRLKYRLRAGNKDKLEQDIAKSDKYLELYEQHKGKCIGAK